MRLDEEPGVERVYLVYSSDRIAELEIFYADREGSIPEAVLLDIRDRVRSGEALSEAFTNDQDIHAQVASQVYGVPLDEVTSEMRRGAKAVNFGVIYGQSAFGLAKSLIGDTTTTWPVTSPPYMHSIATAMSTPATAK